MQSGRRLAIVTQDPTNRGGVLRLVEYIYRRSTALGFEPTLVHYARFVEHPGLSVSALNVLRGELPVRPHVEWYQFEGMRAIALGAFFPEWEPNRLRANRGWASVLDEFDRYLLVTGSSHTGLPLANRGKPFSAWVSSTVASDRRERLKGSASFEAWIERRGLPFVRTAERSVLDRAHRIVAVSDDARRDLQTITTQPIDVLPFPIDTTRFEPDKSERLSLAPQFLFVGRANDPRKRIALFIEACTELRRMAPDLEFTATVVSRVLPAEWANKRSEFRLEHVPAVSDSELIALYQTSTAFVITSEQEGLGIAAMEAMACGLPVISTRCGGPETFIVDKTTGFLVTEEPAGIARHMFELATDELLRARMSAASRDRIETGFSERVLQARFDELIQTLP